MIFKNNIAYRFLTDFSMTNEIIESTYPGITERIISKTGQKTDKEISQFASLYKLINFDHQIAYVVTETVEDKLELLRVKRNSQNEYDWTVFSELPLCKKTFILYPGAGRDAGGAIRILIEGDNIGFCYLYAKKNKGAGVTPSNDAHMKWVFFFINRKTNQHAEHCQHDDVQQVYEFIYKLLCFIFLSENEYEVIAPGSSKGTKKQGKVKNDFPIPITIINSKWNITSIRTEGFAVSGHFALRRVGPGRSASRLVFIEPFEKHGYKRRSGKELNT